ncbi:unnamed protein product [Clonostachys solani]|uniref:Uncharacterized protein n=1 Tax=Clonostachys solani TaxID=160281 RepID=A0A9N9ZD19_9HYPO|nr:unnamed protein product [Clonostachys solani]
MAAFDNDLIPRFWMDPAIPLLGRDDTCSYDTHHNCDDIGFSNVCCPNDHYCFVNKNKEAKCCSIGSNCTSDSNCNSLSYYCARTQTVSGTATTQDGCCARACPSTSFFLCPQANGGNCCHYGSQCDGGACKAIVTASSTGALLTPIQEGCTTSQYRCSDGHGCCDNNQLCTEVSGAGYCVPGIPTQTDIEYIGTDPSADKLSQGAIAGIAVGAVVAAALVIGLATWFCIRKKKERRALTRQTASEGQTEDQTNVGSMAEPTPSASRGPGLTQDYFGPHPVPGPFTEDAVSPGSSPHLHRAVPTVPDQPGDIAAPVEIDGRSTVDDGRSTTRGSVAGGPTGIKLESIQGRFELYGSDHMPPEGPPSIVPTPVEMRNSYFEQNPPEK